MHIAEVARRTGFVASAPSMRLPRGGPKIDRASFGARADTIDAQARPLRTMSRGLRPAAACTAPSHRRGPVFPRRLEAAAKAGAPDHRWRPPARGPAGR